MAGEEKVAAAGGFRGGRPINAVWVEAPAVKPVFADQLQVTRIGDVYHLAFGQVLPGSAHKAEPGDEALIEPVFRVVASQEALARMAELLNKVRKDWERSE
jgi:hypothetical protein